MSTNLTQTLKSATGTAARSFKQTSTAHKSYTKLMPAPTWSQKQASSLNRIAGARLSGNNGRSRPISSSATQSAPSQHTFSDHTQKTKASLDRIASARISRTPTRGASSTAPASTAEATPSSKFAASMQRMASARLTPITNPPTAIEARKPSATTEDASASALRTVASARATGGFHMGIPEPIENGELDNMRQREGISDHGGVHSQAYAQEVAEQLQFAKEKADIAARWAAAQTASSHVLGPMGDIQLEGGQKVPVELLEVGVAPLGARLIGWKD